MKVAMLGPIAWRTPPRHYGPWERVTSLLTEGLVRRGVEVTLFATADSITAAHLESVVPHGYAEDPSMDGRVWRHCTSRTRSISPPDFDLVHNQLDWLPLAFAGQWGAPMVTTIHGFSGAGILPAYQRGGSAFVSISDADRSPAAGLRGDRAPRNRHDRVRPIPLRQGTTSSCSGASTPTRGSRMPSRSRAGRTGAS